LDTLIPTAADLAGDPQVIARAEAVRPAVAAASNEIEEKRRLPPHLLDKLHEQKLFRLRARHLRQVVNVELAVVAEADLIVTVHLKR